MSKSKYKYYYNKTVKTWRTGNLISLSLFQDASLKTKKNDRNMDINIENVTKCL